MKAHSPYGIEIRFVDGSHKLGALEHVTKDEEGKGCTPHFPFERYSLDETVAVPTKRGDIVVFNIHTIHGSHVNTTDKMRRLVRIGYKHPDNLQDVFCPLGTGRPLDNARLAAVAGQLVRNDLHAPLVAGVPGCPDHPVTEGDRVNTQIARGQDPGQHQ